MEKNLHIASVIIVMAVFLFAASPFLPLAHAQSPVTSPSFNCLGPCVSVSPSGPAVTTSTTPQPGISSTPSSPAISGSSLSDIQPCDNSSPNLSSQHREKRGFGERGGFLELLFQFLKVLINALLNGGSLSGISLPCSPTTNSTPLTGTSPAPQPSVVAATSPIVSQPAPTTASATGATSPSNLTPEISSTWAGYKTSTTFAAQSKISTDWVVAAMDCSGGDGSVSPWPGFGGWGNQDPNIAQLGNDMDCKSGQPSYPAWSEAYPAASVYYNDKPMKAGDQMTAAVTYQGSGKFATTMTNKTQGWSVNVPMSFDSGYVPQTAEVIFELLGNSGASVPKFNPSSFTNSTFSPDGKQQIPLASAPGLGLMHIGQSNTIQVKTSTITGGNFSETWQHN